MKAVKVQMKVNQQNLVKTLRLGFSNPETVLSELLQNARRAGATAVNFTCQGNCLTIEDDGCGIGDFQNLLSVAESGWDAETIEREHPFGIGFLSALYSCRRITVISAGITLSADTADILAFKPVGLAFAKRSRGTKITLEGVGLSHKAVNSKLWELARGFPIPVFFNEISLDRPHAVSNAAFIKTEAGEISLSGFNSRQPWENSGTYFVVYLQGLPIYRSSLHGNADMASVIHLDSQKFNARIPDRDKLIDEARVVNLVEAALQRHARAKFLELKAALSPEMFVAGCGAFRKWRCLDIINDVPVLPSGLLCSIDDYPVIDRGNDRKWFMSPYEKAVHRHEIEEGSVTVAHIDDDLDDGSGAIPWMFAWEAGMKIFRGNLDQGHWLHACVQGLDSGISPVEIIGEKHRARFEGENITVDVVFCKSYRLTIGGQSVVIGDESIYDLRAGLIVVPHKDASGFVVRQVSGYQDEDGAFNDMLADIDQDAFSTFVVANTASDPAVALKKLLPQLHGCPQLYEKKFIIAVGKDGSIGDVRIA